MAICLCCKKSEIGLKNNNYCQQCKEYFIQNQVKYCKSCQSTKSFSEFKKKKDHMFGRYSECFDCIRIKRNTLHYFIQNLVIHARYHSKIRRQKRDFPIDFNITNDFVMELWNKQDGKCALSGLKMSHELHSDFKCSLERIDNDLDYTKDNVILIINELNTSKQWTKEKINYFRNVDISETHPKIIEINTKIKILSFKREGYCRTCDSDQIYLNGFCSKCYYRRNINTILINLLNNCNTDTKKRNLKIGRDHTECTITKEDLWNQLQKQEGKCYYSGINMSIGMETDWRISIERLDVFKGYEKNNIVFISNEFNSGDLTVIKSRYEKSGSSGWNHEKIKLLRNL